MSHALDNRTRKATIHLGGGALGTTAWSRFERNIQEDFQSVSGMTTWSDTDGIEVLMVGTAPQTYYVDMIRLSNSMTVEHNVLGPGVIAHILRNRTIAPSAGSSHTVADNWFHYDQVGSVMAISDVDGDLAERRYQDAWGNAQTGYGGGSFSGLWAAGEGWGHNTKETDGGTGLGYVWQRWYSPVLAVFPSSALYPVWQEHPYAIARTRPTSMLDPRGLFPWGIVGAGGEVENMSNCPVIVLDGGDYSDLGSGDRTSQFGDVDGLWANGQWYPVSGPTTVYVDNTGVYEVIGNPAYTGGGQGYFDPGAGWVNPPPPFLYVPMEPRGTHPGPGSPSYQSGGEQDDLPPSGAVTCCK